MSKINAKEIGVRDVQAVYDLMIEAYTADATQVAADCTPAEHAQAILHEKLTAVGYPLVQNLTNLLKAHNTKVENKGTPRTCASTASDSAANIFTQFTGIALNRTGATPAPAAPQNAPAQAVAQADETAADTTATDVEVEEKDELQMNFHSDFTIDPAHKANIDTTLGAIIGQADASISTLLAAMAASEEARDNAEKANASVTELTEKYTAGESDIDESSMLPLPEYENCGYAGLDTTNGMVTVLDSLIAGGISPAITFEEIVTRIQKSEAAVEESRLKNKSLQRDLRRARPKEARPVNVKVASTVAVDNMSFADDLNENVQVADQVASDVFTRSYGSSAAVLGFEIPVLEFDDVHPDVPKIDESFRFYAPVLCEALHSIAENEIIWLHGDSGCGKSEFWGQVAARLNMPFTRMNLDGHLTRSDIIGVNRMLPNEEKQMEMRFVEGILPRAMARPGILLLDEFDLGDPEIMPIFQPILEGKPLMLLEDGGRIVHPHPLFRIAITGNTIGLGSENQMYNNAFEQSAATRDRISAFVKMPYLTPDMEKEVVMARIPGADEDFVEKLIQLAGRVRDGYSQGNIFQIFSTRAVLSSARRFARFGAHYPTPEDAANEILTTVILGRMDRTSHEVVKGFIDNIWPEATA